MPKQKVHCHWSVPVNETVNEDWLKTMIELGYTQKADFIREMAALGIEVMKERRNELRK